MEQATPSLSQAQRLKKFSNEGKLSLEVMSAIMSEEKKGDLDKVTLTGDKLKRYFPKSYTPKQMEETIIKLLKRWHQKRKKINKNIKNKKKERKEYEINGKMKKKKN